LFCGSLPFVLGYLFFCLHYLSHSLFGLPVASCNLPGFSPVLASYRFLFVRFSPRGFILLTWHSYFYSTCLHKQPTPLKAASVTTYSNEAKRGVDMNRQIRSPLTCPLSPLSSHSAWASPRRSCGLSEVSSVLSPRRAAACEKFRAGRDSGAGRRIGGYSEEEDAGLPCRRAAGAARREERYRAEIPEPAMSWWRRARIWPPRDLGRESGSTDDVDIETGRRAGRSDGGSFFPFHGRPRERWCALTRRGRHTRAFWRLSNDELAEHEHGRYSGYYGHGQVTHPFPPLPDSLISPISYLIFSIQSTHAVSCADKI
jgi:hypothetical protein